MARKARTTFNPAWVEAAHTYATETLIDPAKRKYAEAAIGFLTDGTLTLAQFTSQVPDDPRLAKVHARLVNLFDHGSKWPAKITKADAPAAKAPAARKVSAQAPVDDDRIASLERTVGTLVSLVEGMLTAGAQVAPPATTEPAPARTVRAPRRSKVTGEAPVPS